MSASLSPGSWKALVGQAEGGDQSARELERKNPVGKGPEEVVWAGPEII